MSIQDTYFDSNGVRIRYIEQGSGDPIVLIHGFSGSIETGWIDTGVLPTLAKSYRVIGLDYRGHGKSGKPHDPKAYGNEMGRDALRLMDYLEIVRAHIVGYSLGGTIVAKLLTTNPERFLTATLGGSSGRRTWTAEDTQAAEDEATEFEHGIPFQSVILRTAPTNGPPLSEEAIRKRSQEMLGRNDPAAMAALTRSRRDLLITDEQMAAVRIPTLAIVGSADPALTGVNALKRAWPALQVVTIEGAMHSNNTGRGTGARPEFVNAIREFVAVHKLTSSR